MYMYVCGIYDKACYVSRLPTGHKETAMFKRSSFFDTFIHVVLVVVVPALMLMACLAY